MKVKNVPKKESETKQPSLSSSLMSALNNKSGSITQNHTPTPMTTRSRSVSSQSSASTSGSNSSSGSSSGSSSSSSSSSGSSSSSSSSDEEEESPKPTSHSSPVREEKDTKKKPSAESSTSSAQKTNSIPRKENAPKKVAKKPEKEKETKKPVKKIEKKPPPTPVKAEVPKRPIKSAGARKEEAPLPTSTPSPVKKKVSPVKKSIGGEDKSKKNSAPPTAVNNVNKRGNKKPVTKEAKNVNEKPKKVVARKRAPVKKSPVHILPKDSVFTTSESESEKPSKKSESTRTNQGKNNETKETNNKKTPPSSSLNSKKKNSSNSIKQHQRLLKSIFSPGNSSAESNDESKKKSTTPRQNQKFTRSGSSSVSSSSVSSSTSSSENEEEPDKKKSPKISTNVIASGSIDNSDICSIKSLNSSRKKTASTVGIVKGKDKVVESVVVDEKSDNANSSTSNATTARKRPVTRRAQQNKSRKTIPTTTLFSQAGLREPLPESSPPPSTPTKIAPIAGHSSESESGNDKKSFMFESDFSDDQSHVISSMRVPAKTSSKGGAGTSGINKKFRRLEEEQEERKCPFPGCDSQGHLSGKFDSHYMLCCCPAFHGVDGRSCYESSVHRRKREAERKKYSKYASQKLPKKIPKPSVETKSWLEEIEVLRERPATLSPMSSPSQAISNLPPGVSSYDLQLYEDALAEAASRTEKEQRQALGRRSIAMGRFEMWCWYESAYPEPLNQCRRLFVCEFCLKALQSGTVLRRHCAKCVWRHPPGDEIYRKDKISVWEVDGKTQKTYCQNLCLLAKCFLDHKTLYVDVDPFLFYVMTVADSTGCHIVGYFSKEKNSFLNYNVSCILSLPPYMRQGFGRMLIDFSYLLTRVEGKVGSPEKPLSDLGLISYRSYWKDAVLRRLCACANREMSIKDLSMELGVTSADLISTMQFLGMLKYWKGKHLVLKKQDVLEEYLERVRKRGDQRQIDSSCLRWRPFHAAPATEQ